jgi:hypothetical protein
MTLILEDGSGRADANCYADTAFADGYHTPRGRADWTAATVAAREAALIQASDALDATYSFRGHRLTAAQALAWPRCCAEDNSGRLITGVPEAVRRACAELAWRALGGELLPDEARGGQVVSETVGPISTTYAGGAPAGTVRRLVDGLLRELVRGGLDVVRA